MHPKQSWNPAALDWENGDAFPMLLVEVNIAGASVLIVTEIVVIVAVAACVDVSVKADCLRCSECVPVVAFQLLEQVESTYVVLELYLRLCTIVNVLPMPAVLLANNIEVCHLLSLQMLLSTLFFNCSSCCFSICSIFAW